MTAGKLRVMVALLLCGVCAGLAYGISKELNTPPEAPQIKVAALPRAQTANKPPEKAVGVPSVSQLSAITDRPLFFQNRRLPEPSPDAPAAPTAEPKLAVTISGVIITPKHRIALVREASSKEVLHLYEGDKVGDWQLSEITRDSVLLRWKDKTEEIAVENAAPPPARAKALRVPRPAARTGRNGIEQKRKNKTAKF